jgi:hypothetical protein
LVPTNPLHIVNNVTSTEIDQPLSFGILVDSNHSGVDPATSDREQGGIYIDVDSSTTGGDTSNEHRVYGVYTDIRASGDPDVMMGGYFYNEFNGNEGQLTATYGVQAFVAADSSTTGSLISNMVGGHFTAQPQDTGRISTATGVYGVANTATTRVTDVSTMIGGDFEISIDNSAYPITISNIYGVRSVIDINQPFTGSLSALFYGDYQGTLYPSSVYGVYIIDTVDNYFAGKIGIGDATPTNELDVQGSVRIGSGYNSIAAPANGLIVEGNVGIGTTNPLSKLHVKETSEHLFQT